MPAVSFADRAARGSFLLMLPPLFTAGLPIGDGNIKRFLAGPPVETGICGHQPGYRSGDFFM